MIPEALIDVDINGRGLEPTAPWGCVPDGWMQAPPGDPRWVEWTRLANRASGLVALVRQAEQRECGVACVAMLAGVTLERARTVMGYADSPCPGTRAKELRGALSRLGVNMSRRRVPCEQLRELSGAGVLALALVACLGPRGGRDGHWVVADARSARGFVLDPAAWAGRIDSYHAAVKSCYEVELPACGCAPQVPISPAAPV